MNDVHSRRAPRAPLHRRRCGWAAIPAGQVAFAAMSPRLDVELTSTRPDGTFTWRAAGAKEPRGVVEASRLPNDATVGSVLRVEVTVSLDGTEITSVLPAKGPSKEAERLEVIGPPRREESLVTSTLAPKRKGEGRPRREGRDDRGPRDPRSPRDGERRGDRRERRDGPAGERRERPSREPHERRSRPPIEARPKPKRLRPRRTHRNAVLAELPEEHKPIAEQVLRAGVPGVRAAIEEQNAANRTAGRPEIAGDELVALAERLLPALRVAEWRDRADAALAGIDELDLRDLRSVVVAADGVAKDDETRAIAAGLREALARRVDDEHAKWLEEITSTLADGRVVRALRLSSRPPKAGTVFPTDLADRLTAAASGALTAETAPERYAMVLDAVAFAPVHLKVVPAGKPESPSPELLAAVAKLGARVPQIAEAFGVTPAAPTRKPRRTGGGKLDAKPGPARGAKPSAAKPVPPPPPLPPSPAPAAPPALPAPDIAGAAALPAAPAVAIAALSPPPDAPVAALEAHTAAAESDDRSPTSAPPEPVSSEPVTPEPVSPEPAASDVVASDVVTSDATVAAPVPPVAPDVSVPDAAVAATSPPESADAAASPQEPHDVRGD